MADLAAVFQIVSRASSLALELYKLATTATSGVDGINQITKSITSFSATVKQIGTCIREDDSLPSSQAIETLEDVLVQCNSVLTEIESLFHISSSHSHIPYESHQYGPNQGVRLDPTATARLGYLAAHLESLRSTLSVMLQTMHTAQSVIWARTRPTISPQQAAAAVANEKTQLETLIIEQQMSILTASKLYDPSRPGARLLMEEDSSRSLVAIEERGVAPKPANLFRYQERFIASLDTSDTNDGDWLPAICGVSKSHLERLLERWTRLRQLQDRINDYERQSEQERRESQQPTVDTDSEDEVGALPKFMSNSARLNTPTPLRPGSVQPLFTESTTLPLPIPDSRYGPIAPLSPASSYGVSPRSSGASLAYSPTSPRSSISSLPVEAAAAIEAKEEDDDVDLEIPWKLCTRHHYWDFVDSKVVKTNTDLPPPDPFTDRNAWTEILASWVCKEAIREAELKFTKVQKDRLDGRRTKLETCFIIQRPLSFNQVQRLVERTVEIYRQNKPPSPALVPAPPPRQRRTSFDRPTSSDAPQPSQTGDRTPLANQNQPPPLDRSSSFAHPPPPPPPLDRSMSMPGPAQSSHSYPPRLVIHQHPTTLHLPVTNGIVPPGPYSPHAPPYSPHAFPASPVFYSPQGAPFFAPPPFQQQQQPQPQPAHDPRRSQAPPASLQPPPRRLSNSSSTSLRPRYDDNKGSRDRHEHSSASTTSEEESEKARRKHRSRSRRPSSSRRTKHSTVGTLAKVGGLAALLDGIVELGVL